jgi:hypothetical protein
VPQQLMAHPCNVQPLTTSRNSRCVELANGSCLHVYIHTHHQVEDGAGNSGRSTDLALLQKAQYALHQACCPLHVSKDEAVSSFWNAATASLPVGYSTASPLAAGH